MDELNKKLSSLAEISKIQLSKILNSVEGVKDLTLESELIRPLERICGVSWLKSNGIERIFKLEPTAPKLPNTQFFIIYTNIKTFRTVLEIIQSQLDLENPKTNKYHVICVPKILYIFEDLLEELGLYHSVIKLYSFQWFPIHIDSGLLSLEIPGMYRDLFIQQDQTLLPMYAKSLFHLKTVFGRFKFILSLGQYANGVLKQFEKFYEVKSSVSEHFGGLIIMDRSIDYPSALLTPGTYTALLKQVYNLHCGVCESKQQAEEEKWDEKLNPIVKKQAINFSLDSSKDSVYKNIKNQYFTEVTAILSSLTKQLRSEGESSREMALDQIKTYVKTQLQAATSKKKNISNHLVAAEAIINNLGGRFEKQIEIERNVIQNKNKSLNLTYLEEFLQTENDKHSSLVLMCLIAVTQKLSESEIKSFLNKYFLEFGYQQGFLYRNLIKSGFIREFPIKVLKMPLISTNSFQNNCNKLKQIPPDPEKVDLKNPTCCSYVYGGCYIPLVSQVASLLLSGTPIDEVKNKLSNFGQLEIKSANGYPLVKKSLLVYVIGGITYSESAALSLLETLTGSKIVVFSDKYISGKEIADALLSI